MNDSPLVSIVILHYRRRDALVCTLASVRTQSYTNREIIVVANGPHPGVRELLDTEAPEARLVELDRNLGACGGRNAGIRAARGEIVFMLDNDLALADSFAVARTVRIFQSRRDIDVMAFKVCDEKTGSLLIRAWCHPRYWKSSQDDQFETDWFLEGANAVRKEVYETVGLYYEPLFFGPESWDLVLRMLQAGVQDFL